MAQEPNRLKGEFVLLVDGAAGEVAKDVPAERRVLAILAGELPLKQAVKLTTEITGGRKNELYAAALEMKKH